MFYVFFLLSHSFYVFCKCIYPHLNRYKYILTYESLSVPFNFFHILFIPLSVPYPVPIPIAIIPYYPILSRSSPSQSIAVCRLFRFLVVCIIYFLVFMFFLYYYYCYPNSTIGIIQSLSTYLFVFGSSTNPNPCLLSLLSLHFCCCCCCELLEMTVGDDRLFFFFFLIIIITMNTNGNNTNNTTYNHDHDEAYEEIQKEPIFPSISFP